MNSNILSRRAIGDIGENAAAKFLEENGYEILCRNYTGRGGEIDIVCAKQKYLCFVEVKTRTDAPQSDSAILSVDEKKRQNILKAVENFMREYSDNAYIVSLCPRFEIIEVYFDKNNKVSIIHNICDNFSD